MIYLIHDALSIASYPNSRWDGNQSCDDLEMGVISANCSFSAAGHIYGEAAPAVRCADYS